MKLMSSSLATSINSLGISGSQKGRELLFPGFRISWVALDENGTSRADLMAIKGLAELIWENDGSDWANFALQKAAGTKQMLVDVKYDIGAVEDFYDTFMETVQKQNQTGTLLEIFQGYASDTIVCHLRLCTAAELKRNAFLYEGFSDIPLPDLIATAVEPMYVEVRTTGGRLAVLLATFDTRTFRRPTTCKSSPWSMP